MSSDLPENGCSTEPNEPETRNTNTNNQSHYKQLNIVSINVCGLKSQLLCPEYVSFINAYDIICVQESKLDDVDLIKIDGYEVFSHNRKTISRYRSGGITLTVKTGLYPFVKLLKPESKLTLWFTISNKIMLSEDDLYCGIVYIPPIGSKFAYTGPYLEIQNDIDKYTAESKNIFLFGDFNSRTGVACDYVKCDEIISEIQGNNELYLENLNILNMFESNKIPLQRKSVDSITNVYGSQLIEFCKYNNIFMLNGRFDLDYTSPKLTCKDSSVVDYILTSAYNFEMICSFEILEFNCLYSDAHCPLSLSMCILDPKMNTRSANKILLYLRKSNYGMIQKRIYLLQTLTYRILMILVLSWILSELRIVQLRTSI